MKEEGVRESSLPDFVRPPVVEVSLGVQFRPLFALRAIELAGLREIWRGPYPLVQEQPPIPPTIESHSRTPTVQFAVGPVLQSRLWFLDQDQTELVQLQHDRLIVNWRQSAAGSSYPRYPHVREVFERRFSELCSFVSDRQLGVVDVTQVEVTYINAIEPDAGQQGRLDQVLRNWESPVTHHLGLPEEARAALVFDVPGIGRSPVRMYVAAHPAQRPDGAHVVFLSITVRGAPDAGGIQSTVRFMDQAHDHVVRSFAELTPDAMHEKWERQQ